MIISRLSVPLSSPPVRLSIFPSICGLSVSMCAYACVCVCVCGECVCVVSGGSRIFEGGVAGVEYGGAPKA